MLGRDLLVLETGAKACFYLTVDVGWKPRLMEMLTGRNCRENANSKCSEG